MCKKDGYVLIVRSLEILWRLVSFPSFLSWPLCFDRAVWQDRRYNVYVLVFGYLKQKGYCYCLYINPFVVPGL